LEKFQMKKTLVAIAALASVSAFAQSVTLYGVIDQGYYSRASNYTNSSTASNTTKSGIGDDMASSHGEGGQAGSRIGFMGKEDLGGGLAANFLIEMGLFPSEKSNLSPSASSNTAMRIRQSYVGVSGGFGEVQAGRVYTPVWRTQNGDFDPGLNNQTYGFLGGQNGSGNRQANAFQYISPSFNGLKAFVMLGFGQTTVTDGTANTTTTGEKLDEVSSLGVEYRNGPLSVNFATETTKNHSLHDLYSIAADAGGTAYAAKFSPINTVTAASTGVGAPDTTVNAIGVAYDFGPAKVGFMQNSMVLKSETSGFNSGTDIKVTNYSYGVSAPVGASTFFANVSSLKNDLTSNALSIKSQQIGARYAFSKRTDVYYINGSNKFTINGDSTSNAKQSGSVFGIRHQF